MPSPAAASTRTGSRSRPPTRSPASPPSRRASWSRAGVCSRITGRAARCGGCARGSSRRADAAMGAHEAVALARDRPHRRPARRDPAACSTTTRSIAVVGWPEAVDLALIERLDLAVGRVAGRRRRSRARRCGAASSERGVRVVDPWDPVLTDVAAVPRAGRGDRPRRLPRARPAPPTRSTRSAPRCARCG